MNRRRPSSPDARVPLVLRTGWKYAWLLLGALVLYAATAQRSVAWQDSGIFQWRIATFDLSGWLGLALAHPLLILLGRGAMHVLSFLPDPAGRINLVSALAGAVTVANLYVLILRLGRGEGPDGPAPNAPALPAAGTGSKDGRPGCDPSAPLDPLRSFRVMSLGAGAGAAAYAFAHTPWWLGTICESQALFAALFTTELLLLVSLTRRPRLRTAALLGLVSGLGWSTHNLALLGLPCYVAVVVFLCLRRRLPWRALAAAGGLWVVGALPMLGLIVQRAMAAGLGDAVRSALFGDQWQGAVLGAGGKHVAMGFGYILYNFPNLALPLAVLGALRLRRFVRGPLLWALAYLAGVYFLFAIRYQVTDQFAFFLPFYVLLAAFAGLGLASVGLRLGRGPSNDLSPQDAGSRSPADPHRPGAFRALSLITLGTVLLTPAIYLAAPVLWSRLGLPLPGRKDLPFRDPARYWLQPWKFNEDSAEQFAAAALRHAAPDGTILSDGTALPALRWLQTVRGVAPGVTLLHFEDASPEVIGLGTPNVFVVSNLPRRYPAWLDARATLVKDSPDSVLYRVRWNDVLD